MDLSTIITLVVLAAVIGLALLAWTNFQNNPETEAAGADNGTAQPRTADTGETDWRRYDERTYDELYQLAIDRDIEGRSTMRKAELIEALRED